MGKQRLYLFDTTLRDGAQTSGVDFTLADKLAIAGMLDELAAMGVVLKDSKDGTTWEIAR